MLIQLFFGTRSIELLLLCYVCSNIRMYSSFLHLSKRVVLEQSVKKKSNLQVLLTYIYVRRLMFCASGVEKRSPPHPPEPLSASDPVDIRPWRDHHFDRAVDRLGVRLVAAVALIVSNALQVFVWADCKRRASVYMWALLRSYSMCGESAASDTDAGSEESVVDGANAETAPSREGGASASTNPTAAGPDPSPPFSVLLDASPSRRGHQEAAAAALYGG